MGRSMSMSQFVGTRIAGQLSWVPAHIKPDGTKVPSRVEIPVYANTGKGKDPRTGEKGRKDSYKFVVWGPMADTCCKSLPTGRQLSIFGRPDPFLGTLYNADHTPRLDIAGKEIIIPKTAYVVFDLLFGNDSAKGVATEIQTGRRPHNWNVPNHVDWATWVKVLNDRQASIWDGRSPTFEYARVVMPRGAGIVIDFAALTAARKTIQQEASQHQGFPDQNLPNMVAATFGANIPAGAKFDPMTGQPIIQQPAAKFDPQTGQPIGQQKPVSYDPQTGQPIYAVSSGFQPQFPNSSTALF